MKIAALYDIHGNYHALKAVLEEIEQENVDTVVIGGDLAWGPQPKETLDLLMKYKNEFLFVQGNADREVVGQHGKEEGCSEFVAILNEWCFNQLTYEQTEFMGNLPFSQKLNLGTLGNALFVHGSPNSDEEAIRFNTPEDEVYKMINGVEESIIICGHTHIQFDRSIRNKRVVNAGSVGLQSKADGACWLLIDETPILKVTKYDKKKATFDISNGECPYKEDFIDHIVNPPNEGP